MENQSNGVESGTTKVDKADNPSEFKMPVLFGRVGKLPKKIKNDVQINEEEKKEEKEEKAESTSKSSVPPAVLLKEVFTPIPYREPKWSGLCPEGSEYGLEVLKSGMIVEKVELMRKAYYVFGRLANCDVVMAHPTISRHHAVLQYKAFADEGEQPAGWYLYDLGSTHGTFLNKERLKPSHYTRVRVGHQIRFGSSTRTYIMLGPDFDCEGESELSVTEIKQRAIQMKLERDKMIQEAKEQKEKERLEEEKKREEQGIDWGMGDDAEEEPDLSENPYASTTNEQLYLADPKKTLRGYCEREGHELTYMCEERAASQFLCRVELPHDDAHGRPIIAEVIHRGKKKEAVVQCALEACRILDRAGLLRQATHESRRRKQRDWSTDDYYDSDEDIFLDRTGAIERKRKIRMIKHGAESVETDKPMTYDDLVKQVEDIEKKIVLEEKALERLRAVSKPTASTDEDDLDAYMKSLGQMGQSMAQKADISRTKMAIQKLKAELSKTQRLADIARPAHLPPLLKKEDKVIKQGNNVVYGKRIKLKEDQQRKPKILKEKKQEETEFVEEMDSDEDTDKTKTHETKHTENNVLEDSNNKSVKTEEVKEKRIEDKDNSETEKDARVFGPMRPPENYVIPDSYFDQTSDRDLPEITEK